MSPLNDDRLLDVTPRYRERRDGLLITEHNVEDIALIGKVFGFDILSL